ncbi:alpha/beta hydrolase [Amycolatopsis nigrescens]|uniref:alpha/beta hydrolase n=1 Tax=Amycolatopsis nigrescens TaxID=381445 RepID=UPI000372637D|nr:alpha/beta hydrolase [Amycolatopsis nigrescens]
MVVGALAGGLLLAPAGSPATAAQGFSPAPIAWGACQSDRLKKAGAECGFLEVPMDYREPDGPRVSLAVSRVRHKTPNSQGVMLVNPGGPGGSGLGLSVLGGAVPGGAGNAYDWIGFDPRGVGSSKPALSCDGNYFGYDRPEYVPSTPELERAWLTRSENYAKACEKNGPLLEHLKTTDVARDMESLREALGERQINYYGFSYGTYLGQVYGTMFPDRVRRMVLDSNVDARKVWYQANLDQDVAFDRNIKIFFDWVAQYDGVYHLGDSGATVEKLFYSEQKKLAETPAGGVFGPDEWTDVFLQAGYYRDTWKDIAGAFAGWVHGGDWQTLKAMFEDSNPPGDDNGFAVYNGVQCTDVQWPPSWQQWRFDNWTTHFRAPFNTWGNAWFNAPCRYWPAKAGKPVEVDGRKVAGALLIGETLDAATPFEGSLETRRRFPKASLIAEPGGATHADSLAGNACVDDQIAAYLADGKLPPRKPGDRADTECAPLPDPVPDGVAAPRSGNAENAEDSAKPAELRRVLVGR